MQIKKTNSMFITLMSGQSNREKNSIWMKNNSANSAQVAEIKIYNMRPQPFYANKIWRFP
jgi:hypothetical protein